MLSPILVAVIDLAFPVALASVLAQELVAGQNYHNLRIRGVVAVLTAANLAFHTQGVTGAADRLSPRTLSVCPLDTDHAGWRTYHSSVHPEVVAEARCGAVTCHAALIASLVTYLIAGMGIASMPMLQLSTLMWCSGYSGFVVRFCSLFFRTG